MIAPAGAVTSRPAWEWRATGTRWRIYHSGALAPEIVDAVRVAIENDERRWSRFRPGSEVSALNASNGDWTPVSSETLDLLMVCQDWTASTNGVFQPLVGGALEAWGYRHSVAEQSPFSPYAPESTAVGGSVELDRARGRARIPAGSSVDLGGIGKSWIAARAATLLLSLSDDRDILLDAGGDLLAVRGQHVIAVESVVPRQAPVIAWVRLREGQASATSGFGRRNWTNGDGSTSHHLIDPDTGAPGPRTHATVIADDIVAADVRAKLLALRPACITACPSAALVQIGATTVASGAWRLAVVDADGITQSDRVRQRR